MDGPAYNVRICSEYRLPESLAQHNDLSRRSPFALSIRQETVFASHIERERGEQWLEDEIVGRLEAGQGAGAADRVEAAAMLRH